MKIVFMFIRLKVTFLIVLGTFLTSCSRQVSVSLEQLQRVDSYVNSENHFISGMFFDESLLNSGLQPSLLQRELDILDMLADRIPPEVREIFDEKYTAWINCWTPLDLLPNYDDCMRQMLNCNGLEFRELIEFCRQQNDDIFLLLYQLAARAHCPFDRMLLQPAFDLLDDFPEFSKYWREVDMALQKEKPDMRHRICNESTIWFTRKILETKYGFTYTSELANMFDNRKALMTSTVRNPNRMAFFSK